MNNTTNNAFQHISTTQSREHFDKNSAVFVDIRDLASFQAAHIPHAAAITNDNVQDFIREADLDKPLIVYCYHGNASQGAAQFFAEQGFEQVFSMDGGFEAWRLAHPVAPEN